MPDKTVADQLRTLVTKAIRAAVPPGHNVERKIRPESDYTWLEPTPLAGLHAALTVAKAAQRKAYDYARDLRGQGTTWREIADLLEIPWSDEYSRPERAYELVLGPAPKDGSAFHQRNVYWHCGGPLGCGNYITDHGPYNGHPRDDEDGHAEGCRRLATEVEAYERESREQEARDLRADEAMQLIAGDGFATSTVARARWVQAHGGKYLGWSTSETLAVALVLHDDTTLRDLGHSRDSAVARVFGGMANPPAGRNAWLAAVRTAATGEA